MGTCCSSDDHGYLAGQTNMETRRLVNTDQQQQPTKREPKTLSDESASQDASPTEEDTRPTSIFEQLQDADSTAMSGTEPSPDLGLTEIDPISEPASRQTTTDSAIGEQSNNNNRKISRKQAVQTQPSYVDAQNGMNKNAHKIKEKFSMLKFISTSPTLVDDPYFHPIQKCQKLQAAFKMKSSKDRARIVASILTSLSEEQRLEVAAKYVGPHGEKLKFSIEDSFSGDVQASLLELVRSSAQNDCYWINKSLSKFNVNSSLLNEILCTRTNEQLVNIIREYKSTFGVSLEQALSDAMSKSKSYLSLLKSILSLSRKESDRVNEKDVSKDIRRLYLWLEETNNWEKNKSSIVDIFVRRSWMHICAVCDRYCKKSNYDLQVLLNKKFGGSSKTGDALNVILSVSRDRWGYFAFLLRKAMKGLGTDDGLLIRTVISRSRIDLQQVMNTFSRDASYGEGKTMLQWIKGDTSGIYQFIMLSVCNLDATSLDRVHSLSFEQHKKRALDIENGNDSGMIVRNLSDLDDQSGLGWISEENKNEMNWDHYLTSSPTVTKDETFEAGQMADYLNSCFTSKDKKIKKKNKEVIIRVMTKICNEQRQELFMQYKRNYNRHLGEDIRTALGNKGKGKSLYALLALLQTPAQHDAYSCRKAIKTGDWKLLSEILCTRTNAELEKIKKEYNKARDKYNDLARDVGRMCGKKSELRIMFDPIVNLKRSQTLETNYELVKKDVDKLVAKKGRFGSRDKDMVANILGTNSWAHIRQVSATFGTYSEKSLEVVIKDVFGSGSPSYFCAETIYLMSTNRASFWCRLLKESMSGMSTNQQLLIRVLITRSETDLGEIAAEFARKHEFGGGKTLKQWIRDATKGSFQHLLLRISGLYDDDPSNDDNKQDSEQSLETSVESNGNLTFLQDQDSSRSQFDSNINNIDSPSEPNRLATQVSNESNYVSNYGNNTQQPGINDITAMSAMSAASIVSVGTGGYAVGTYPGDIRADLARNAIDAPSETTDYRFKMYSQQSTSAAYDGLDGNTLNSLQGDSAVATLAQSPAPAVANGPNESKDESNVNMNNYHSTGNAISNESNESNEKSKKELKEEELEQVDVADMAWFMLTKMTENTVNKLWSHIDEDGTGLIGPNEVLPLMTFTAVLYNAYKQRVHKDKPMQPGKMDKNKIRKHLTPLCNWIGTVKMVGEHKQVGKHEFTTLLAAWMKEFARINA